MHAVVLYESTDGNIRTVAENIAQGLLRAGTADVQVHAASALDRAAKYSAATADLLVLGAPATISNGGGLAEYFDAAMVGKTDLARTVAVFDIRIEAPFGLKGLNGSAARRTVSRLRKLGIRPLTEAESFFVTKRNQLIDGEVEHARAWGAQLAALVQDRQFA